MVFLKDINYKDIKTLKTEFFFFSPQICITYVENGVQGACLGQVIVVDPGEEKWTRRGIKKMYYMDFSCWRQNPKDLLKGLAQRESFDLREEQ